MTLFRALNPGRAWAAVMVVLLAIAIALVLTAGHADAQQISTDTTYRDESLVFTEDVVVVGGAKLAIRGCDVTFRPPATSPLYLRVVHGTLEITDTDILGEGAGFIVSAHGDSVLRNVTATGLGAVANSSLRARDLPMSAHGGFMFFSSRVSVYNLDISDAPATGLYAEDCEIDIFSLGVRDACSAYTGTDQCVAVAIVYLGSPSLGNERINAELNSSKIESSLNHGVLVAAASTGYSPTVSIVGTDISTSASSGLVVYEVNSHGTFRVRGDTNELHHATDHGVLWVRDAASGQSYLDLAKSRLYSNKGSALRVVSSASTGSADLALRDCTIEDTTGHGAAVTATSSTQYLNVTLEGCEVTGCGGSGLYFTTDGDGQTSSYHMRLVDTVVTGSGSYGIYSKVSQSYCAYNLSLEGTQLLRSRLDGIRTEYSLQYFSYTEAPSVAANLTVQDSLIANSGGYGIYETRYLTTYYYWATAKSTLYAAINILGTTIENHTKTAVYVVPTTQLQYCNYATEAYIGGSTFSNNSGYGYYEKVDSLTQTNGGSTRVGFHVWDSAFSRLTHTGVYVDLRRASDAMVLWRVEGCAFSELGQHGAVLTTSSTSYIGKVVANLRNCTFHDLDDYAYYLNPGRPGTQGGDSRVAVEDVRADNTTGIYVSLDGYSSTEDYFELAVRRVNVTRTRGSAIDVRVHPYYAASMVTDLRDIYTRDTNGTALSLSYTSDKNQPLWGDLTGDNITLIDQVGGLVLSEHTGILSNLTILGSTDFDLHKVDSYLPSDETGILELHSVTMDRKKAKVVGEGSLWVFNELHVKVEWQNGMAALGAGVQIQDRTFTVVSVGHVDTEDGMEPVELLAYILDEVEFRSRSPFVVNITFLDLEQTGVCSLDKPAIVRIVVHDRVAPSVVVLEPDDGAAQRASFFELRGSAFDAHAGLLEIRYRIDGGSWTVVGSTSPYRTTVEGVEPGEHLLEVEVEDRAGNIANELIHIEVDNQPPELVVVSPPGDVLTREPLLVVRGETEEGASVSINGDEVETLHGLFIAEVRLEEGANTVTVVSMDRLSNVATIRFTAVLDTVEPFVDVTSHDDVDWVGRTDQTISGVVEEGCSLTVNGEPVDVFNQSFEALVQLVVGENTVVLEAVDPAGNVFTKTITIHVANEPPWVHLESPDDGALLDRHEVRVLGTVQPGSVVTVNGRRVTIQKGLLDELLVLPEGTSTITIEAVDDAGNVNTVTRVVTVDTIAPVLTLDPLPGSTRDGSVTVSGVAEGAARVLIDGTVVALDGNGSFAANVTLAEGTNVLHIVARDGVGLEDQVTAEVVLDTTPPFLRLILPDVDGDVNGTLWSKDRRVHIQVLSEPGASVTLNDIYVIVGQDGAADVDLELDGSGDPLTVRVVAVDDLGNSEELVYTIAYREGGGEASSLDWVALLPTLFNIGLLVVIVVIVARYRSMVRRSMRRRRGPRPPNGRGPNGRPNGGPNGRSNGGPNGGVPP